MGSAKGSTKQTSTQTNEPPAWAKPMFEKSAAEAQRLYNEGSGYNVYTGPTQAQFSPQRLEGLNNAMKMTGSTGPQITNESVFNNPAIQQARAQLAAQQDEANKRRIAAAMAAAQAQQASKGPTGGHWERMPIINGNSWGMNNVKGTGGGPMVYVQDRNVRRS